MILGFLSFLKIKEQTHLGIHVCKWKFYFIKKKKEKKKGNSVQSVAIKEGERDRKHTFEGNKGCRRS